MNIEKNRINMDKYMYSSRFRFEIDHQAEKIKVYEKSLNYGEPDLLVETRINGEILSYDKEGIVKELFQQDGNEKDFKPYGNITISYLEPSLKYLFVDVQSGCGFIVKLDVSGNPCYR